jgi:hypothetical protein
VLRWLVSGAARLKAYTAHAAAHALSAAGERDVGFTFAGRAPRGSLGLGGMVWVFAPAVHMGRARICAPTRSSLRARLPVCALAARRPRPFAPSPCSNEQPPQPPVELLPVFPEHLLVGGGGHVPPAVGGDGKGLVAGGLGRWLTCVFTLHGVFRFVTADSRRGGVSPRLLVPLGARLPLPPPPPRNRAAPARAAPAAQPPAQRRLLSAAVTEDHERLRRTLADYRDAMGREARGLKRALGGGRERALARRDGPRGARNAPWGKGARMAGAAFRCCRMGRGRGARQLSERACVCSCVLACAGSVPRGGLSATRARCAQARRSRRPSIAANPPAVPPRAPRQAAAEAVAAGAQMLAAAAPEEGLAQIAAGAEQTAAATVAAISGVPTEAPAFPAAAAAPPQPAAAPATGGEAGAPAPLYVPVPPPGSAARVDAAAAALRRADLDLAALTVAGQADAARAQAAGRREALAARLARQAAAHEAAELKALVEPVEARFGAAPPRDGALGGRAQIDAGRAWVGNWLARARGPLHRRPAERPRRCPGALTPTPCAPAALTIRPGPPQARPWPRRCAPRARPRWRRCRRPAAPTRGTAPLTSRCCGRATRSRRSSRREGERGGDGALSVGVWVLCRTVHGALVRPRLSCAPTLCVRNQSAHARASPCLACISLRRTRPRSLSS